MSTKKSISPRERRSARTYEHILDAARQCIAEKGIEKFSLREVAKRADYSPAGLYEYFSSKDALIMSLALQVNNNLYAVIEKKIERAEGSIRDKLIAAAQGYLEFAFTHQEDYMLLFARVSSERQSTNEEVDQRSAYSLIYNLVQQCLTEKIFNQDRSTDEIAYGLWALLHGQVMLQLTHLKNFDANFEEIDREIIISLINGFSK